MNQATTPSSVSARPSVSHEEISRHAQELWEKYGRPTGRDEEIWLEAERDLQNRGNAAVEQQTATQPEATSESSAPAAPPPLETRPVRSSAASATAKMPSGRNSARRR